MPDTATDELSRAFGGQPPAVAPPPPPAPAPEDELSRAFLPPQAPSTPVAGGTLAPTSGAGARGLGAPVLPLVRGAQPPRTGPVAPAPKPPATPAAQPLTVPTAPVYNWQRPHSFSIVGNYQQLLDKLPPNAPPQERRQAEIKLNQARVAQGHTYQQQVTAHDALVQQLKLVGPQLTRLWAQAKQGKLTPATVALLKQQTDRLNASAKVADLQLGELQRVHGALEKWGKANAGKWVHNGQYFPWELNPDGTPKSDVADTLRKYGLPLQAGALAVAHQLQGAAQQRGEFPPLPAAGGAPYSRDELSRQKNALIGLVRNEWDLEHPDPQTMGSGQYLTQASLIRQTIRHGLANLTPFQQQLLPILRLQVAVIGKTEQQAGVGKATAADIISQGIGQVLGVGAAGLTERAFIQRAIPEVRALLTGSILKGGWTAAGKAIAARAGIHFVGGAAGGAAGAGTATTAGALMMGAPLPKAIQEGGRAAVAGAVIGGPLAAIIGPAAEVAGEATGLRPPTPEPGTPAGTRGGHYEYETLPGGEIRRSWVPNRTVAPRPGTAGRVIEPYTEAEAAELAATRAQAQAGRYEKRAPGTPRPEITPAELAAAQARFGNLGSYSEVERLQQTADEAAYAAQQAKRAAGPPGTALQFEEPPAAVRPAPREVAGGPRPATVITGLEGEPVPYRTLTPDGAAQLASRFAAAVAGGTLPPGQEQDAVVAQALARDVQAYEAQRGAPQVPFDNPRFSALWKRGKIPAARQFAALDRAATTLQKRGETDLAERLQQAAQEVRRDALFDHGNNLNPPDAGTLLPPPLAAPYRQFTPEELQRMGPAARQALLVQDASNSLRVTDPASAGVYALNEVPGATAKNLDQVAEQAYQRANDIQAATYSNIPVPQVSPEATAAGPQPATSAIGSQPAGASHLQQVSPATSTPGTATAPQPPSLATGPAAASPLATTEAPLGQEPQPTVPAAEAPLGPGVTAAGEGAAGFGATAAEPSGVGAAGVGGTTGSGARSTVPEGLASGETAGPVPAGPGSEVGQRGQRRTGVGGQRGGGITEPGATSAPVAGPGGENRPAVAGRRAEAAAPGGERATGARLERPVSGVPAKEQSPLAREGLYVPYQPPLGITGAPHPAPMVETRSLAAVERPAVSHALVLPHAEEAVRTGAISALQLDTAAAAGARHDQVLGDGARAGFLVGDSTGAGKTIGNAAIIGDNWERGNRKTIYFSVSPDLAQELAAALKTIGYGHIPVKLVQKFKASEAIPADFEGVVFVTYGALIEKGPDSGTFTKQERRLQLQRWLGHASDGSEALAIFDESHRLKRSMAKGAAPQSQRATAALKLQQALPGLRVVYSSATAASELGDMGYMTRLGLWGKGTAWPTHPAFVKEMAPGGTTMLELIGRDLKSQGAYLAREISFEGTEYEPLPHELTLEQKAVYNQAVLLWRDLRAGVERAAEEANLSDAAATTLNQRYWLDHMRFFRELLTAFKVPSVVEAAQADIAAGRAPVVSLLSTGEAAEERRAKQALATGVDLEDLDASPAEIISQFIANALPPEAEQTRETMRRQLNDLTNVPGLRLPGRALDELLAGLGHENAAEVSGRKNRFEPNAAGEMERVARSANANKEERTAFMEGEKPALIFSGAGRTGFGYHAAKNAKNQGRRVHYVLEHAWSADEVIQDLGRTHRTNQVSAPLYRFVTTDAAGEARFAATIARRLAALGAITRGERAATGGGNLAQYDVENDLGRQSLENLVARIKQGQAINDLGNPRQALVDMGLAKATTSDRENVKQFLNRLMGLEIGPQNALAAAFFDEFEKTKAYAVERGRVDVGVRALPGTGHQLTEAPVEVYVHPELGTRTLYYSLTAVKPDGTRVRQHLLSGGVLPIWDELKIGQQKHFNAYTVTLPGIGEVIGIGVAPNSIKRVLSALNVATLTGPRSADMELETQVLERRLPGTGVARAAALAVDPAVAGWQQQFTPAVNAIVRSLAAELLTPEERRPLTQVATLLTPAEETGVTMGATVREGGRVRILIAPFVPTVQVVRGHAQATWTVKNDDPEVIAGQLMQTIIHELAHLRTPAEGEELEALQAELWQKLLANPVVLDRAAERLHRLLTGGGNDLARSYREGRDVYVADAGRELRAGNAPAGAGLTGTGQGVRGTLLRRLPTEPRGALGHLPASRDRGESLARVYQGFKDEYTVQPVDWETLLKTAAENLKGLLHVYQHLDQERDAALIHLFAELTRKQGAARIEAAIALAGVLNRLVPEEREFYDWAVFVNDLNEQAGYQIRQIKEAKPAASDEDVRRFVNGNLPRGMTQENEPYAWTLELVVEAYRQNGEKFGERKWKNVEKAINDRREMFSQTIEPYLAAMQQANGRKIAFDRTEYLHHEILYFLQIARLNRIRGMNLGPGTGGGSAEMAHGTEMGRGFLKPRRGSTLPYLTDPVAADMLVLSQMHYDTLIFEIKSFLQRQYDQSEALFKMALAINHDQLFSWVDAMVGRMNSRVQAGQAPLTAEDIFRLEFRPKQEAGFERFMRLAAEGQLPDTQDRRFAPVIEQMALLHEENLGRQQQEADGLIEVIGGTPAQQGEFYPQLGAYMQWLGTFESGKEGADAARKLARAGTASRRAIKEALLSQEPLEKMVTPDLLIRHAQMLKMRTLYKPTADLLRPYGIEPFADLVGWRPGPESAFKRAWGTQDRMADALMADGAKALGLEPEAAAEVLSAQHQDRLYLPSRIVATLNEMAAQRPHHWLDGVLGWAPKEWRSWIILGPPRLLADFARRQTGHFDLTVRVHPQGFQKWVQAEAELTRLLVQQKMPRYGLDPGEQARQEQRFGGLLKWISMGGLQTTYQQYLNAFHGMPKVPWKLLPEFSAPGEMVERNVFTKEGLPKALGTYFSWAERLQDFREAVWRYAHYLAYLEELEADHAKQGGPKKAVQPRNYSMSVPDEIDALETLERKAFALSDDLLGAYGRISSGSRVARQKLWDIPFYGFREANLRRWTNLWANSLRSNPKMRELGSGMAADLGLRLISGGAAGGEPPELPPPPSGGPGDPDWDEWKRKDDLQKVMQRAAKSRWRQILWLLKNKKLAVTALGSAIVGLGWLVIKQVFWSGLVWAYNHYVMGAKQQKLGEAARNRGAGTDYLILPFLMGTDDVQVFNRVGTGCEVLRMAGGFDDLAAYREAFHNAGLQGVANWWADRLVTEAVGGVGVTKMGLELLLGESFYPDAFNRRKIPNRAEYAADAVALGTAYRALMKHPQPEGRSWLNNIGVSQYDGREQNYVEVMDAIRTWKQYQPGLAKGVGTMADDEKSMALYQFKRAVRQGLDGRVYLKNYLWYGGTAKGLKESFQRMEPLYGLSEDNYPGYRGRLLRGGRNPLTGKQEPGMTPEQQARLRSAYWYVSDLAQPPVEKEARDNQAALPIEDFVKNMEGEMSQRLDAWLPPLVQSFEEADPELQKRLGLLEQAKKERDVPEEKKAEKKAVAR